jgi:ABC-2 type transport system ATP-binding protein
MTDAALVTEKLTRRFGGLTAVDGIDLQVTAGQFFGFLGPNGAGKSTTIKMLTGLLAPPSGRVQLLELDFSSHTVHVKRQIGVVPEGMGLFERLTGSEYLNFVGRMYGLDRATTRQRSDELLEFMQLADRPKSLIVECSQGTQKTLALAAAVIHGPRILFLDEPFEGVDALAAGLKALLARMTESGVTIFLTSHVLEIVDVSAATSRSLTKVAWSRRARSKSFARKLPAKKATRPPSNRFSCRSSVSTDRYARKWQSSRG